MLHSIRYVIRGKTAGRSRHNFNWTRITSAKSAVWISAGEVKFGTVQIQQVEPRQDFHYHLGEATVWVTNVGPHKNEFAGEAGGVEFHLHSDFDGPIDVGVTIVTDDRFPEEIQGF